MGTFYVDENGMPVQIPVQRPWHEKLGRSLAGVAAGMRDPSYAAREYSARDAMLSDAMNQRTSALMRQKFEDKQSQFRADQDAANLDIKLGADRAEGERQRKALMERERLQGDNMLEREKYQATSALDLANRRAGFEALQDARRWNTDLFKQASEQQFNEPFRKAQADYNAARTAVQNQQLTEAQEEMRPLRLEEVGAYLQTIQDPATRARVDEAIKGLVSLGLPVTFAKLKTVMQQSNPKSFAPGSTINQFLSTPTSAVPSTNAPPAGLLPNGNLKL